MLCFAFCFLVSHRWFDRIRAIRITPQGKNEHHVLRGVALLSRAYVESAAARHGVDVDVDRISKGIDLGRTDKRIVGAAKRALDEVHRQRLLGPDVDIVDATRELDEAFSRLRKAFCYE